MKTQRQILAEKIANELFTAGNGEKADHLKLFKNNLYLGGWAKKPATDRIEMIIKKYKSRPRP